MNQKQAAYFLGAKSTNPKDLQGIKKIPYHLFPATAIVVGCLQMLDGGGKYGRENYRSESVCASVYFDANQRHMQDWFHGQDLTLDTKLMHLGGALASVAILIDATVNGKLIDDRAYINRFPELVAYATKEVQRLTKVHKDKKPHHYSKLDLIALEKLGETLLGHARKQRDTLPKMRRTTKPRTKSHNKRK